MASETGPASLRAAPVTSDRRPVVPCGPEADSLPGGPRTRAERGPRRRGLWRKVGEGAALRASRRRRTCPGGGVSGLRCRGRPRHAPASRWPHASFASGAFASSPATPQKWPRSRPPAPALASPGLSDVGAAAGAREPQASVDSGLCFPRWPVPSQPRTLPRVPCARRGPGSVGPSGGRRGPANELPGAQETEVTRGRERTSATAEGRARPGR